MMSVGLTALAALIGAQQAQPDLGTLASALDRCMTTYAVRLTHTDAADEAIYVQATQGCLALKTQLTTAINAQLPAVQAAEILQAMETQGRPNFMTMLARIRSDRARRAGQ